MRHPLTTGAAAPDAEVDENRTELFYWWLMLAIFFEYARPASIVPILDAVKANSLIPLGLFVLVLVASGLRSFGKIFRDRQIRWLTAFLVLTVVSVPIADVTERAFNMFITVLGYYFLVIIIARVVTSWRRLRGIFFALIASHVFLIARTPGIVMNTEVRSYIEGGTFLGDGNDFSLSLCVLIPLTIEAATGGQRRLLRWVAWASVLLFCLAIVGTQSRGGTLGIASVGVFLWLLSKRKVASLAGIVLVAIVALFYASDAYFERMSTIRNYQNEGSAMGRIIAWKAGVNMAVTNPVFGVGVGHFPIAFGTTHRPREAMGAMPWLTAHSSYILVLGELGFPGIIVFLALVIGGFRSAMGMRRRLLQLCTGPPPDGTVASARVLYLVSGAMIGFAVAGAFLSAAYYPHIFVLTGLMFAARSLAQSELERVALPASAPRQATGRRAGAAVVGRAKIRTSRESGT